MLNKAVAHPDANLRVDVFALLCETRRATEEFDGGELEVLKGFLGVSLDSQSPEFRQRV